MLKSPENIFADSEDRTHYALRASLLLIRTRSTTLRKYILLDYATSWLITYKKKQSYYMREVIFKPNFYINSK